MTQKIAGTYWAKLPLSRRSVWTRRVLATLPLIVPAMFWARHLPQRRGAVASRAGRCSVGLRCRADTSGDAVCAAQGNLIGRRLAAFFFARSLPHVDCVHFARLRGHMERRTRGFGGLRTRVFQKTLTTHIGARRADPSHGCALRCSTARRRTCRPRCCRDRR